MFPDETWKCHDNGKAGRVVIANNKEVVNEKKRQALKSERNLKVLRDLVKKHNDTFWTEERRKQHSEQMRHEFAIGKRKISKEVGIGKNGEYKGVMFRSTWERNIARLLDACCIKWEYESHKCHFDVKGIVPNRSMSVIDFYLPEFDLYLEPHSVMDDFSVNKYKSIMCKYGVTIVVIDPVSMRLLTDMYSDMVEGWEEDLSLRYVKYPEKVTEHGYRYLCLH